MAISRGSCHQLPELMQTQGHDMRIATAVTGLSASDDVMLLVLGTPKPHCVASNVSYSASLIVSSYKLAPTVNMCD